MTLPRVRLLLLTGRADTGGGPRHVDLLVRHLPPEIDLWIAAPDELPFGTDWRRDHRVHDVITLPSRQFSLPVLWRTARLCRRAQIDIAYSHGPSAGLYARLLKLLVPRLKVAHAFHGMHAAQYTRLTRMAFLGVERTLRMLTDVFVHVSQGECDRAVALGVSDVRRAVVIRNALPELGAPNPDAFPELAVAGHPVIVMLTRFQFVKNIDLALDIAALAQQAHPHWRFAWAGDGPDRARIEAAAAMRGLDTVTFLGTITRPVDLLGRAAALLSTSRWEGLPYALLEASSMGVPIVATRVPGNEEVVRDGENGLLFAAGSAAEGVASLARVLDDSATATSLSGGGRRVVAECFSFHAAIDDVAKLMRTLAHAS